MKLGIPYKVGDGPWRMDVPLLASGEIASSASKTEILSEETASIFRYRMRVNPGDGWTKQVCTSCADDFYAWSSVDEVAPPDRCYFCRGVMTAAVQSRHTESVKAGIERRNL